VVILVPKEMAARPTGTIEEGERSVFRVGHHLPSPMSLSQWQTVARSRAYTARANITRQWQGQPWATFNVTVTHENRMLS
jgi:hypothetical protein